jgi:hypothetical protein
VHSELVGVDNHGCGWSQREGRRFMLSYGGVWC